MGNFFVIENEQAFKDKAPTSDLSLNNLLFRAQFCNLKTNVLFLNCIDLLEKLEKNNAPSFLIRFMGAEMYMRHQGDHHMLLYWLI